MRVLPERVKWYKLHAETPMTFLSTHPTHPLSHLTTFDVREEDSVRVHIGEQDAVGKTNGKLSPSAYSHIFA